MDRRAFLLGAPALLAACSSKPRVFAEQSALDAARWPNTGPGRLQVFSSFNVGTNNGAHTAMLISADEHVVFDPAGTFRHSRLPERHDVIYGMVPSARQAFVDYHTRSTFWTVLQTFEVPRSTAFAVKRAAERAGPVSDAFCTRATSTLLADAPGMPFAVDPVWFPVSLHDQLLGRPGVIRQEFRQTDDADKEVFWETVRISFPGGNAGDPGGLPAINPA
ncbi:MAG: hypothetical protein AAGA47_09165 [Pseudomonadota bacterium]